jgi:hypothetical protein
MIIIGVGFHPEFHQNASVDTESGEFQQERLAHRKETERFYRALAGQNVRVGMEASGPIVSKLVFVFPVHTSSKHSTLEAVSGPMARQVGSEDSNGKIDGLLNAAGRGRDDWKLVGTRRCGRRVGVGRVRIAPAASEPQR